MVNKINIKLILELKASGLSQNAIASTRHISKKSISAVVNIAKEKRFSYEDIRDMNDDVLYRMFFPEKHTADQLYQFPEYDYVHQELKKVGVTLNCFTKNTETVVGKKEPLLSDTQSSEMITAIMFQRRISLINWCISPDNAAKWTGAARL